MKVKHALIAVPISVLLLWIGLNLLAKWVHGLNEGEAYLALFAVTLLLLALYILVPFVLLTGIVWWIMRRRRAKREADELHDW